MKNVTYTIKRRGPQSVRQTAVSENRNILMRMLVGSFIPVTLLVGSFLARSFYTYVKNSIMNNYIRSQKMFLTSIMGK